jgi:predicted dehydrogenase
MLEKEELDLVAICTPSGVHPDQVVMAAKHGVHVMTEKPMATRWQDGVRMVKACDDAGVRLFVVKQNRRNSTLQLLKRAVSEKRFGKIHMVHLNVFWTRPQDYYDQAKWRGTWEFDGGAFMNQASHYVDLLDSSVDVQPYFENAYKNEEFVKILPKGTYPETRSVKSSNYCQIAVQYVEHSNKLVIMSVIDNLVKGAAGQDIQNMNLMFGLKEHESLSQIGLMP